MSMFSKILSKLGLKTEEAAPAAEAKPAADAKPAPSGKPAPSPTSSYKAEVAKPAKPEAMPMVDVVAKLDGLAAKNPQELNWKRSIVDLLKLLDIDSSLEARKELATELHCPANLMDDFAEMNTWLHKAVMNKIAENGGNIPKELLD